MHELGVALDVEDGLLEFGVHGVDRFERIVLEDLFADSSQRFSFGFSSGE